MQLSASYLTSLTSTLDTLTLNEESLTNQLSSGVRINALSDDPTAVGENVGLSTQLRQDDSYQQASANANSMLQVTDSALGSVISQLNQAVTLATQGVSGVGNNTQLGSITSELGSLRDEILSLANSSYQGTYLFAGSQGTTQPFTLSTATSPATVAYHGDQLSTSLTGPDGSKIPINFPGQQVFTAPGNNVLGTLNQLISDFQSGNTTAASQLVSTLPGIINYVGQQRSAVDESMTRISYEQQFLQQQSTQLTVRQTALMQSDVAGVATALSSAETQQTALEDAIGALEKQPTLFSVIGS